MINKLNIGESPYHHMPEPLLWDMAAKINELIEAYNRLENEYKIQLDINKAHADKLWPGSDSMADSSKSHL